MPWRREVLWVLAALGVGVAVQEARAGSDPDLGALLPHLETRFVHQQWTAEDGLPVDSLTDVVQTADGWLWIASLDGLLRFDGVELTRFDRAAVPAVRSNRIHDLLADPDGTLWILSEVGHLTRYAAGAFTAIEPPAGVPVRGLAMARAGGALWLGSDRGLFRGAGDRLVAGPMELARERVTAVGPGRAGRVWLATESGRLASLAGGSLRFLATSLADGRERLAHDLAEDGHGVLWMGSSDGLLRVRGEALERVGRSRPFCPLPAGLSWYEQGRHHGCRMGPEGSVWEIRDNALLRDGRLVYRLPAARHPDGLTSVAIDREGTV